MKLRLCKTAAVMSLFAFACTAVVLAQDRGNGQENRSHTRFDEHDRQVTNDWYNRHKDHPPAGLREQDRLSPDQESRMHEGVTLDPELRGRVHNAPSDLRHELPPPPSGHRYVTVGGHVGLIDHSYQVKDVIHLHENRDNRDNR